MEFQTLRRILKLITVEDNKTAFLLEYFDSKNQEEYQLSKILQSVTKKNRKKLLKNFLPDYNKLFGFKKTIELLRDIKDCCNNVYKFKQWVLKKAVEIMIDDKNNVVESLSNTVNVLKPKHTTLGKLLQPLVKSDVISIKELTDVISFVPDEKKTSYAEDVLAKMDFSSLINNREYIVSTISNDLYILAFKTMIKNNEIHLDKLKEFLDHFDDDDKIQILEYSKEHTEVIFEFFTDIEHKLQSCSEYHKFKNIDAIMKHFTTDEERIRCIKNSCIPDALFPNLLPYVGNDENKLEVCKNIPFFSNISDYVVYFGYFSDYNYKHLLFDLIINKVLYVNPENITCLFPHIMPFKRHKYLKSVYGVTEKRPGELTYISYGKEKEIKGFTFDLPENCPEELIAENKRYFLECYQNKLEGLHKELSTLTFNPVSTIVNIDFNDPLMASFNKYNIFGAMKPDNPLKPVTYDLKTGRWGNCFEPALVVYGGVDLKKCVADYAKTVYLNNIEKNDRYNLVKTYISCYQNYIYSLTKS